MNAFRYDLHTHSCLSPCGDDEATPYNIAGMGKLNGLDIVALTDHNTCGNCKTFLKACRDYGITGVPGMELTTAEDVHLVCLFPDISRAEAFEAAFRPHRILLKNRPEVFGHQLLIGPDDEPVGEEEYLLINASNLSISEAAALADAYGAAVYPAHVDREGNGIIAMLGDFPEEPAFAAAEFHDEANIPSYVERFPALGGKRIVVSSDAHRVWELQESGRTMELDCTGGDEGELRQKLITYLRGGEV